MPARKVQGLFYIREEGKNIFTTMRKDAPWSKKKTDRMEKATEDIPEILNLRRELSDAELGEVGWMHLTDQRVYIEGTRGKKDLKKKIIIPFAAYVSPTLAKEKGNLPLLEELRRILCDPAMFEFFDKATNGASHKKDHGTIFDTTFSVLPNNSAESIRLSKVAQQGHPKLRRLNELLALAYMKTIEAADFSKDNHIRWTVKASITAGHHDNTDFSHAQINFTATHENLGASLKKVGGVHVDSGDEADCLTVWLSLSNSPDDWFEGRMNLYSAKMACSGKCFGALVFSARHPHGATGVPPYDESVAVSDYACNNPEVDVGPLPKEWPYRRVATALYSRMNNIRNDPGKASPMTDGDRAINAFGTELNLYEYKLRKFVKDNVVTGMTVRGLQEMFSWTDEEGIKQEPREKVAGWALQYKGARLLEYDERRAVALDNNCGDDPPLKYRKSNPQQAHAAKKSDAKKAAAIGAKLEDTITKECKAKKRDGKICGKQFPGIDGIDFCGLHRQVIAHRKRKAGLISD